jgi:diaminopimelate epimerase
VNWQWRRAYFDLPVRLFVIPSDVACHAVALCEGGRNLSLYFDNNIPQQRETTVDMTTGTAAAKITIMLRFTKMNGAGNDFILIDNRAGDIRLDRSQIARLCDRHRGIGADGVLLLEKPSNRADFRMRYFNADGGEAEMCGNGARCFARFANKIAGAQKKISFETPAGVIAADLVNDLVTLKMTEPTGLRINMKVPMTDEDKTVHFINSGVPHVVIPVSRVDDVDVRREGSAVRYHKMFSPNGANVNFVEKRAPNLIAVRTYERGVEDETLACGTGVVASALIFAIIEKANGPITVIARGGDELQVGFERSDNQVRNVTLTGPAEFIFEGSIEI